MESHHDSHVYDTHVYIGEEPDKTMSGKVSEIVEMPMNIPERTEGRGLLVAGADGTVTAEAMADRARRTEGFIRRVDYRECISCDRCGNCLEIRGFTPKGEEKVLALYCPSGEMEVSPYHTCNQARRTKKAGRKKVIYELTNAPKGFELGMGRTDLRPSVPGETIKLEPTIPVDGYRGGSKFYRRMDGDEEAEGSGKIPRGLTN